MTAQSCQPRLALATALHDLDIIAIAESSGDYMLIPGQFYRWHTVFDKDIQVSPVKDNLFFQQVPIGDHAWLYNHTGLHLQKVSCAARSRT